jgi:predicted anti-sigma-YlaC factor YlaD
MNCDAALILMYDLVDGEISANDQQLLNKHLSDCSHCQAILKSIQKAEKFYQEEFLVTPSVEVANTITKNVWERKNVVSFPLKQSYSSTQKILYYVGAMAASFVGFVYLAGSLAVSQLITKIDFSSYLSNINQSINNPNLDINLNQFAQVWRGTLTLLLNINPWTSHSNIIKVLTVLLTLFSIQFAVNYLFTQRKQDKSL